MRRASWLALLAGADVIKTSTGKISPAATLPVVQVMLQAVRDWHRLTGERAGSRRPAGSAPPRTRSGTWSRSTRSPARSGCSPALFRFGASSLLNDLLRQRRTQLDGHYVGADYIGSA